MITEHPGTVASGISAENDSKNHNRFQVKKFADIASDAIRDLIFTGVFKPGDRINEVALSEEFHISRTPIREALRNLSAQGLLRIVPGKGAYVPTFDLELVHHIGEVRVYMQREAARLAAIRADEHDIQAMHELIQGIQYLETSDEPYPHQHDFERLVGDATKNPQFARATWNIESQIQIARVMSGNSPIRARKSLIEHREIYEAIAERNPELAAQRMEDHIRGSIEDIVRLITDQEAKANG